MWQYIGQCYASWHFWRFPAALGRRARHVGVEQLPDGIRVRTNGLLLHVRTDSIVRVTFATKTPFRADDMVVIGPKDAAPKWSTSSTARTVTLTTPRLRVTVSRADGAVAFADASGRQILAEAPGGHRITPADVQGEQTSHVQQVWQANDDESIYGLGQRQEGKLNVKGTISISAAQHRRPGPCSSRAAATDPLGQYRAVEVRRHRWFDDPDQSLVD